MFPMSCSCMKYLNVSYNSILRESKPERICPSTKYESTQTVVCSQRRIGSAFDMTDRIARCVPVSAHRTKVSSRILAMVQTGENDTWH